MNIHNIKFMYAVHYIVYFNLLEILVNIINHKHYLIIIAIYHSSNMNNAHTMSPADMVCQLMK